ncbi:MAG: type II toxin-antitoxin system RelE family toxin [Pseudonocardiaceae bacterium]
MTRSDGLVRRFENCDSSTSPLCPRCGDQAWLESSPARTRALTGYPPGTMRLRIGDYRVVYVVRDDMVLVTVVHRREAYRGR